jgi:hypothetical protein
MLPISQPTKSVMNGGFSLREPAGQKLIDNWPVISQQIAQIGQDVERRLQRI